MTPGQASVGRSWNVECFFCGLFKLFFLYGAKFETLHLPSKTQLTLGSPALINSRVHKLSHSCDLVFIKHGNICLRTEDISIFTVSGVVPMVYCFFTIINKSKYKSACTITDLLNPAVPEKGIHEICTEHILEIWEYSGP